MRPERVVLLGLALLTAGCAVVRRLSDGAAYEEASVMEAARRARDAAVISPQAEESLGREAAANLAAKYGLHPDDVLQRYVNLVGRAVARHARRASLRWRFGVLDAEHPNAYAAPGGFVFVTRGLLAKLKDEAELAAVLAHEIEHVDRRHALRSLRRARTMEAGALLLSSREELDAAAGEVIALIERGYDAEDEMEADREGVLLLARTGYDPSGFPRALERHPGGRGPERARALVELKGVPDSGASAARRFHDSALARL